MMFNIADVVANLVQRFTRDNIHSNENILELFLHNETINNGLKLHSTQLNMSKKIYMRYNTEEMNQHIQHLNSDLINTSIDAERDMFDQKSEQFRTLIFSSSVMFTSLAIIITQGFLPLKSNIFIIVVFSLSCAVSFGFLFFCIVLSMELISKTSTFMNKKSKCQKDSLKNARKKTHRMMKLIKKIKVHIDDNESTNINIKDKVQKVFRDYENTVEDVAKARRDINNSLAVTNDEISFTKEQYAFFVFWRKYCTKWGQLAFLLFFSGLYTFVVSMSVYIWSIYIHNYVMLEAALCSVIMMSLLIIVGFTIHIFTIKYQTVDDNNIIIV